MAGECGKCPDCEARDDTIVALQWLVRDLRHEIANLRTELELATSPSSLEHDEAA